MLKLLNSFCIFRYKIYFYTVSVSKQVRGSQLSGMNTVYSKIRMVVLNLFETRHPEVKMKELALEIKSGKP